VSIPFGDEGHQALGEMREIREITDVEPLALQDAEPLLDLVHPGTMGWQEMANKAGMERQPLLSLLAMMDTRIIKHKVDLSDRGGKLLIQLGEQSDKLHLSLAYKRLGRDLTCARIKGCKEMEGTTTFVFMLHAGRQ
jgi:hypothetical protein